MRRVLFGQSECRGAAVCYYLVTEKREGRERYGLQVKYDGETETIPDITTSRGEIQALLKAMARGVVTPVSAREVVEDWLSG